MILFFFLIDTATVIVRNRTGLTIRKFAKRELGSEVHTANREMYIDLWQVARTKAVLHKNVMGSLLTCNKPLSVPFCAILMIYSQVPNIYRKVKISI